MSKADRMKRIKAEQFIAGGGKPLDSNKVPSYLNKDEAKYYKFIINSYSNGILKQVDELMLSQLAIILARMQKLDKYIDKYGMLFTRKNGSHYMNPALKARKSLLQAFKDISAECALTITSRSKLATVASVQHASNKADPLKRILNAKPNIT